jgi:hypothetical protein
MVGLKSERTVVAAGSNYLGNATWVTGHVSSKSQQAGDTQWGSSRTVQ